MQNFNSKSQSGFSLIEVMVVMVIVGVLVTVAVVRFDRSRHQFQRQNVVNQFKTFLERARFDSVKRRVNAGEETRVRINSDTSFSLIADFNQDGNLDATNEVQTFNFTEDNGGRIIGNFNYPVNITFDRAGRITATNSINNAVTPSFTFCSQNCPSGSSSNNLNSTNATVVTVSPAGTVAVAPAGYVTSNPANANVTVINSNSGVSNKAFVNVNAY